MVTDRRRVAKPGVRRTGAAVCQRMDGTDLTCVVGRVGPHPGHPSADQHGVAASGHDLGLRLGPALPLVGRIGGRHLAVPTDDLGADGPGARATGRVGWWPVETLAALFTFQQVENVRIELRRLGARQPPGPDVATVEELSPNVALDFALAVKHPHELRMVLGQGDHVIFVLVPFHTLEAYNIVPRPTLRTTRPVTVTSQIVDLRKVADRTVRFADVESEVG